MLLIPIKLFNDIAIRFIIKPNTFYHNFDNETVVLFGIKGQLRSSDCCY
jgi:hypothetical protein